MRNSDKVLTPIVSLEMDDAGFDDYMKKGGLPRNLDDDVDFFFNNNPVPGSHKRSLHKQDSLDGYANRKPSVKSSSFSRTARQSNTYFSPPLASLHISKIGVPDDTEMLLSQTLSKASLGLDSFHATGFSGLSRNVGGGGKLSHLGPGMNTNIKDIIIDIVIIFQVLFSRTCLPHCQCQEFTGQRLPLTLSQFWTLVKLPSNLQPL